MRGGERRALEEEWDMADAWALEEEWDMAEACSHERRQSHKRGRAMEGHGRSWKIMEGRRVSP